MIAQCFATRSKHCFPEVLGLGLALGTLGLAWATRLLQLQPRKTPPSQNWLLCRRLAFDFSMVRTAICFSLRLGKNLVMGTLKLLCVCMLIAYCGFTHTHTPGTSYKCAVGTGSSRTLAACGAPQFGGVPAVELTGPKGHGRLLDAAFGEAVSCHVPSAQSAPPDELAAAQ